MAAKTFKSWRYTADDGTFYRVRVADYISSQMDGGTPDHPKIGGEQAASTDQALPKKFKLRTALVKASGGRIRRVPVFDTTAYLWTNATGTIQLDDGQPPSLVTFTRYGLEGERSRHDRLTA